MYMERPNALSPTQDVQSYILRTRSTLCRAAPGKEGSQVFKDLQKEHLCSWDDTNIYRLSARKTKYSFGV